MKKINNVLIGCDPELFLEKNNEIISAVGRIGGSKHEPKFIDDEKKFSIQEDNIMIEFNIPPCNNVIDFVNNINYVKLHLEMVAKLQDCNLNFEASSLIKPIYLKSKQAKEFGCEPDFNVYTKSVNPTPNSRTTLRSCGGHIHIGYDNPSQEITEKIIYAMDICLGLESLHLDPDYKRRLLYGKAGCFRFKPYGVEYRTLSNFWIKNDNSISWAFNQTLKAIDLINNDQIDYLIQKYSDDVKKTIDNNDKDYSLLLLKEINNFINVKQNI